MIGELTSQVENLATAFPEEAVGVGAKWETRQAAKTAGQVTFQKTITEVVSIDGTTIKMKYTTEQTIPPQALTNSMLPADVAVQMDGSWAPAQEPWRSISIHSCRQVNPP
jgi:hypothetical protein